MFRGQPLREAVSWNEVVLPRSLVSGVSLFVRLWVEISYMIATHTRPAVSLFVRLWVEMWSAHLCGDVLLCQPLREAVSWNIRHFFRYRNPASQPLREAVSWNIVYFLIPYPPVSSASSWGCELKWLYLSQNLMLYCQPLREAVSWNVPVAAKANGGIGQPLREAVSWNVMIVSDRLLINVSLFVRLWVEINFPFRIYGELQVSLFVRLWVEISTVNSQLQQFVVSLFVRLWVEITAINGTAPTTDVSLFVRLWVEMCSVAQHHGAVVSASSWGCELKYTRRLYSARSVWVSLFVRLWVEILRFRYVQMCHFGQPLREAVSWNTYYKDEQGGIWLSASSWGCELKHQWNVLFNQV